MVVTATLALGLATNLPGDPLGVTTMHLVVFGDFTPGEIGESFSTLFPDASENNLINDLENVYLDPADPSSSEGRREGRMSGLLSLTREMMVSSHLSAEHLRWWPLLTVN